MSDITLNITEEERVELLRIVNRSLEEARVEVHRTHSPNFRDEVIQEENILRALMQKLTIQRSPAKV